MTPWLAIAGGLLLGALGWWIVGGASAAAEKLDATQAAANALRRPRASAYAPVTLDVAALAARPLFVLTTGAGASVEPVIRLDGISRSPRRNAALLSLDGGPSGWWLVGETHNGVTLQEVLGGRVIVDTPFGPSEISLDARTAPPAVAAAAQRTAPARASIVDELPPGVRSPPPPASAPVAR